MLVTAHSDLGLPTLIKTEVNRELVHEIVHRLTTGSAHRIDDLAIDQAYDRHGANVREILFELYDVFESRRRL